VVPTYNGAPFLGDSLRSVAAQVWPPDTVVVVDDASTDESATTANRLLSGGSIPFTVLPLPANSGGPARPINTAIAATDGDLIAVLDQDDAYEPDHFARCRAALAADDLVFVFCRSAPLGRRPRIDVEGLLTRSVFRRLCRLGRMRNGVTVLEGRLVLAALLVTGNFIVGYPGFVFRRESWVRKGGVDESVRIASDYDLLCWLCTQGPVGCINRPLFRKRVHGGNLSLGGLGSLREGLTVAGRYAGQAGGEWCRRPAAVAFLRGLYVRRITGLAWAGDLAGAWARLHRAGRRWGWSTESVQTAAKLAVVAALWVIGRVPRSPVPDHVALWNQVLDLAEAVCDTASGSASHAEARPSEVRT
jgi:hypothetical protein